MKFVLRISAVLLILVILALYAKSASAYNSSELPRIAIVSPDVPYLSMSFSLPTRIVPTSTSISPTAVPTLDSSIAKSVQRIVYDAKNNSTLPGAIVRKEGDPKSGDVVIDSVYDSIGDLYDFFWINYGRDSIDGKGMVIKATVHYQNKSNKGLWNGKQLVFGDGDGDLFNSITTPDMIAHQYMLGIIQYEAGLASAGQSGALNESFGDVFASLFKQYQLRQTASAADWIIGEGIFTSKVNGEGLRSLKAPGTAYIDPVLGVDPQPAHMRYYVFTTLDSGGIQINSGIPNHAFYIVATEIGGYAWEKAGVIWYVTLRDKLLPNSNFQDAANQTFMVAGDLYGVGSLEQEAVRKGWADVGISVQTATSIATPIAPPPGDGCLPSLLGVIVFGLISYSTGYTSKRDKFSLLK